MHIHTPGRLLLAPLAGLALLAAAANPPAPALNDVQFALIPKRETGVPEYLKKYPTYDGRGVVIAIFDTGVDPTAAGLQTTTTGEPKVIDVIDSTGGGDVDLAAPAKPAADGTLAGKSGRKLTLPANGTNPSGEYRLGLKPARELFGPEVMERMREQRRRDWDQQKRDLVAERLRMREAAEKARLRPAATKPESELTTAERDTLARETLFDALVDGTDPVDPEPVFDCVVWNDGSAWRVVVDTDEDGDLRDEVVLRPYGIAQETALFGGQTGCRFAAQVYDEGKLLSLVTVVGSHGTHVAGIAAAHFPENPARNGIAPGARILSVKIGDTRLGSSADGTGYLRALAACARHRVDAMNMSFGGPNDYQDGNETGNRILRRLVMDYGVTAFLSVGNSGPALSTLGGPGDTPEVIGVGAYVSKEMGALLYSAPDGSAETTYGFTSRGPAKSGHLGVAILGPGGAIAPVPFDSLSRTQLMNGTSMSSPSVAGVGALLISGAKQAGLKSTPARIKAALMNTAKPVPGVDPWTQGPGLAQVLPAFEHLRANQGVASLDIHFRPETSDNPLAKGPGIYWRDARPAGRQEARFTVTPQFLEVTTPEARQAFEEDVILESSAPWVEAPRTLHLANGAKPFSLWITVPEAVPAGAALFAEVRALPAGQPGAGPIFRIPVTVITPQRADVPRRPVEAFAVDLTAGAITRAFYEAPADASHLRLKVRRDRSDLVARTYEVRATSLASHEAFTQGGFNQRLRLEPGEDREFIIPVRPGRTVELTWHQMWNSPAPSRLEGEFSWISVQSESPEVVITDNQRYGVAVLRSARETLPVEVSAKLTEGLMIFPPVETRSLPGDDRDVLPPAPRDAGPVRLPVLRQKFEFKVETAFKAKLGDPRVTNASSEIIGSITRITHESGKVLWHGGDRSGPADIDFPKGTITAYRDFRAIDTADAQRQSTMPLVLRRALPANTALGVYPDSAAAAKGKKEAKVTLAAGRDQDVFFEEPAAAVFKDLTPAPAWFTGEIEITKDKQTLLKLPVVYHRGVAAPEAKRPAGEAPKPKRTALEDAREELYQKQLGLLKPLREKKDAESVAAHEALLADLQKLRPEDPALPYERAFALAFRAGLLEAKGGDKDKPADTGAKAEEPARNGAAKEAAKEPAKAAAADAPKEAAKEAPAAPSKEDAAKEVFATISSAVAKIDAAAVAAFLGAPESAAPDDTEAKRALAAKRKEFTSQRDLLRDYALLRAEVNLQLAQVKEARAALLEAQRWEATPATPAKKWRELEFATLRAEGHLGLALQTLQDNLLKENPLDRGLREKRIALLRELGWNRWADREALKLAVEKGIPALRF